MNDYYELYILFFYVSILTVVCLGCSDRESNPAPRLMITLNESFQNQHSETLLNQHSETCFKKEEEGDCIICLEQYGIKELRILKCFHCFHKECIDKWIETSNKMECPICSYNIL